MSIGTLPFRIILFASLHSCDKTEEQYKNMANMIAMHFAPHFTPAEARVFFEALHAFRGAFGVPELTWPWYQLTFAVNPQYHTTRTIDGAAFTYFTVNNKHYPLKEYFEDPDVLPL
jgi:hypothetical protein